MILLGSVERSKLIGLIARQISREKRLRTAAQWQKRKNDRTGSRRFSYIETRDVTENVKFASGNRRQSDGLKNRRTSNIVVVEINEATGLYDVTNNIKGSCTENDGLPLEPRNTETITSNCSDNTILEHLNESTKLLKTNSPKIFTMVITKQCKCSVDANIIFPLSVE